MYMHVISVSRHEQGVRPHSTYAQRERGGVKSNAYDCVQGVWGGFQGCVRTKIFFGP